MEHQMYRWIERDYPEETSQSAWKAAKNRMSVKVTIRPDDANLLRFLIWVGLVEIEDDMDAKESAPKRRAYPHGVGSNGHR